MPFLFPLFHRLYNINIGAEVAMGALGEIVAGAPEGGLQQNAAHKGRAGDGQVLLAALHGEMPVHGSEDCAVGIDLHRGDVLDQAAELAYPDGLVQRGDLIDLVLIQALYSQLLIAGGGVGKAMENARESHVPVADLPAGSGPAEAAELEDRAVFLIELRLSHDLLFLHRQQMLQVQLIAETSEEGHIAPGGQGRGA